jgi:hypothetical protein
VLRLQSSAALGSVAGGTSVSSGAALEVDGTGLAIAEPLSIAGDGIASAGVIRNITGTNSLTGGVTLTAATRLNSDAGTLTIATGATTAQVAFTSAATADNLGNFEGAGAMPAGQAFHLFCLRVMPNPGARFDDIQEFQKKFDPKIFAAAQQRAERAMTCNDLSALAPVAPWRSPARRFRRWPPALRLWSHPQTQRQTSAAERRSGGCACF